MMKYWSSLVGAFLRSLAAASAVDFLDDESAGGGMRQDEVYDAALRDHDLVRRAVEQVLAHPVAAGNAVDAGRNVNLRQTALVGLGLVNAPEETSSMRMTAPSWTASA
jgi:hypothetical protein